MSHRHRTTFNKKQTWLEHFISRRFGCSVTTFINFWNFNDRECWSVGKGRSKFTGYLGRVLGKIWSEKAFAPPNFFWKILCPLFCSINLFGHIIFLEKKVFALLSMIPAGPRTLSKWKMYFLLEFTWRVHPV